MSLNGLVDLLLKYCDAYLALLPVWSSKHCVVGIRVEGAETSGVVAGIDCVDEPQIRKVVDIDTVLEDDNDSLKVRQHSYLLVLS